MTETDEHKNISQNDKYFRIEKNTAWVAGLIVAALIFFSNLIGTWVLQSKDISTLTVTVQALASDQKTQDGKIILSSERIAILENTNKTVYNDLCEIKKDLKSIREDQIAYYKARGFKSPNGGSK